MEKNRGKYSSSYERQAVYYDAIYEASGKDYKKEAAFVHHVIEKYKKSEGNELLDVGCGTGGHLPFLKEWYSVGGLDIDPDMLQIARKKLPEVSFHQVDMVDFDLGKEFDVISCLFSAIGYAKTVPNLESTIKSFERHLKPGGVVVVEPWISPEKWHEGTLHAEFVDKPDLKIARMNVSGRKGNISIIDFHFLVATPGGIESFNELHEIGLFTQEEYLESFKKAGLETSFDPKGITDRGLYIGVKPL